MTNRLRRDLVTLRRLLTESGDWQLTPEQWNQAEKAIDHLADHLAASDGARIDAVLRKLEEVKPGSRAVTRLDDPRRVGAPESIRARMVDLVPVIVDQIDRIAGDRPSDAGDRCGGDVH